MGPKQSVKSRARRTHSLGGCATCRRRHVKCDQVQPYCLTCRAVGVTCEGYSSNLQWTEPSTSSDKAKGKKIDTGTTRRHLYTEKSRASMSTELTAALSSNSVDASLTEIDSWGKNSQPPNGDNLAVGPFGVLSFNAPAQVSPNDNTGPVEVVRVETEQPEELFPTPSTLDPLMSLDDSLQWADLFALDFGNEFLMQQDPFGPIVPDLGSNLEGNLATGQTPYWNPNASTTIAPDNSAGSSGTAHVAAPVSPLVTTTAPSTDLLGDTHFLLRHFQDNVISAMAGVPYTAKSPWKTQNLAAAVQTLADMTYLGEKTVKHANAANLYSLVSCAARHIAVVSPNTPSTSARCWPEVADWALLKAKLHLEQSMRVEFHGPGRAKYKDQLMATIATTAACQLSGNEKDVRRYMLEAEKVLRLRGLAKREISRKARLLHHVYTWTRIVGESTYVIHDYNSYAPVVQSLNQQHLKRTSRSVPSENMTNPINPPSSSHNARLDDFLRIETQHDSDLEIDEQKEATVGLHDIHLEDARDDPASMYLQIYGIPETWLSLVSQTTRLANVMDTVKVSNKETNVAFQHALQKRAGRLENMICSFAFKAPDTSPTTDANPSVVLPNHYMVQALNSALVIFFYRRIRDVNPWILQSHVDDVIKALQDFDKALVEQKMTGPGTAWPAFIAGCEAIAPHRRETLLRWIQAGRAQSGVHSYRAAEEMLTTVWKKRDETNNGPSPRTTRSASSTGSASRSAPTQWTWVDTSREKNVWLMLC